MVFLSATGGPVGLLLGVGAPQLRAMIAGWPIEQSLTAVLGAFRLSAMAGVFFGDYPARKSAALNPIEALRCA
ncbi:MAG: ABC transporter permease [Steroidobacteraceae bacterium]